MTNPKMKEIIIRTRKTQNDLYHEIFERRGINLCDWQQTYLSNSCDPNSAISRMTPEDVVGLPPKLEGFEQVIGEKWGCKHCSECIKTIDRKGIQFNVCNKFHFWFINDPFFRRCMDECLVLSDETKAEIKLHDYELYPAGYVDIHPRFIIGLLGEAHDGTVFFIKKKEYYADCMFKTQIKLELIW